MELLYSIALWTKIFACIACVCYCYSIARLKLTPTFTYMLLVIAFGIRLALYGIAYFYTSHVIIFLGTFPFWFIVITQIMEAMFVVLCAVAFARKHSSIKIVLTQLP